MTAAAAPMEPGIDTCEEEDALLLLQLCKAQRHLRADASPSSAYQCRDTVRPESCSCLQHVPLKLPPSGAPFPFVGLLPWTPCSSLSFARHCPPPRWRLHRPPTQARRGPGPVKPAPRLSSSTKPQAQLPRLQGDRIAHGQPLARQSSCRGVSPVPVAMTRLICARTTAWMPSSNKYLRKPKLLALQLSSGGPQASQPGPWP